ncbi:hypothetical protein [uncultured Umboniibacter sp.]|uniref:hypothetical protein n=1 Tax=uncultured Umboniibacter sp. TaxID=1798917 RepID=UPI002605B397|nr:hypothetical protein [uncultured Umboniibacter sp.]
MRAQILRLSQSADELNSSLEFLRGQQQKVSVVIATRLIEMALVSDDLSVMRGVLTERLKAEAKSITAPAISKFLNVKANSAKGVVSTAEWGVWIHDIEALAKVSHRRGEHGGRNANIYEFKLSPSDGERLQAFISLKDEPTKYTSILRCFVFLGAFSGTMNQLFSLYEQFKSQFDDNEDLSMSERIFRRTMKELTDAGFFQVNENSGAFKFFMNDTMLNSLGAKRNTGAALSRFKEGRPFRVEDDTRSTVHRDLHQSHYQVGLYKNDDGIKRTDPIFIPRGRQGLVAWMAANSGVGDLGACSLDDFKLSTILISRVHQMYLEMKRKNDAIPVETRLKEDEFDKLYRGHATQWIQINLSELAKACNQTERTIMKRLIRLRDCRIYYREAMNEEVTSRSVIHGQGDPFTEIKSYSVLENVTESKRGEVSFRVTSDIADRIKHSSMDLIRLTNYPQVVFSCVLTARGLISNQAREAKTFLLSDFQFAAVHPERLSFSAFRKEIISQCVLEDNIYGFRAGGFIFSLIDSEEAVDEIIDSQGYRFGPQPKRRRETEMVIHIQIDPTDQVLGDNGFLTLGRRRRLMPSSSDLDVPTNLELAL